MLVWALGVALAQEPGAAVCSRAIGAVGGVTFGGRDFDLTTPGPYATSVSPALSQVCFRVGKGDTTQSVVWIGYDAAPLLVHSYGRLGERAPIWGETHLGYGRRIGRNIVGLGLFTNTVEVGLGARWLVRLDRDPRFTAPSAELRVQFVPAADPELRVGVLFTFGATRMDTSDAPMTPGPRLRPRPGELVGLTDTERNAAKAKANRGTTPVTRPKTRFAVGFEAGTAMGLRAEVVHDKKFVVGLRAVAITSWRTDTILQPTVLLTGSHAIGPTIAAGTTRLDGAWIPVGGVGWTVGGTAGMRLHGGLVVGPGYLVPDLATIIAW